MALDAFPKATLDVWALVLQAGGSELAVAVTAAAAALADAGVEMRDLVAACSVVRRRGVGWGGGCSRWGGAVGDEGAQWMAGVWCT